MQKRKSKKKKQKTQQHKIYPVDENIYFLFYYYVLFQHYNVKLWFMNIISWLTIRHNESRILFKWCLNDFYACFSQF